MSTQDNEKQGSREVTGMTGMEDYLSDLIGTAVRITTVAGMGCFVVGTVDAVEDGIVTVKVSTTLRAGAIHRTHAIAIDKVAAVDF